MKKVVIIFYVLFISLVQIQAQMLESFVHKGEVGGSIGLGHYFGDINNSASIGKPKFSAGLFYRKQFNNYIGLKVAGNYSFLGYTDAVSKNPVQRLRNLSFNTDVWELSVSGDFNFFKFYPGFKQHAYTPYVSLGVGVINYDPYAYLAGEKYFLRSLGTEGQGSALYPNFKQYNAVAMVIPLGFGIKYNLNQKFNVFGEISYRFTTTDYLDDVSGLYAGPDAFALDPNTGLPSAAFFLQDRSYEYGNRIGIKGRQRGNSKQKDAFATFQLGVSINIQSYKCPTY